MRAYEHIELFFTHTLQHHPGGRRIDQKCRCRLQANASVNSIKTVCITNLIFNANALRTVDVNHAIANI